jgi:choline dehydrogenase-like flavoprotein
VDHGPGSPVGAAKRIAEAVRQGRIPEDFPRELFTVATRAGVIAREARHRRKGVAAPLDRASRLVLRVQTEQPPDGPSRLRLSSRLDRLGTPLLEVDWHVGAAEHRAAVAVTRAFADTVRRSGLAELRLVPWLEDRTAFVRAARDYFHHAGTTRMAERPEDGVVDARCAVHGVTGLHVVGGSVFPSSGFANPTLTIVALALRLAGQLDGAVDARPPTAPRPVASR